MDFTKYKGEIESLILLAIQEDIADPAGIIPPGDHTALACLPSGRNGSARLLVKASGCLSGVEVAAMVCRMIDPQLSLEIFIPDGALISKGDIAFNLHGPERSLLQAERILLNFMQRMSGIATNTKKYADRVAGTKCRILDTRKTTPGLRALEKLAVTHGGGHNHRFGLYDMILLKDNHIDFCGGIKPALLAVKAYQEKLGLRLPVEIETRSLDEVREAIETGHFNRILFDNFTVDKVFEAVELVARRFETEASGGVNLDTVISYAEAGPDFISVGALTHSSAGLDMSLKKI